MNPLQPNTTNLGTRGKRDVKKPVLFEDTKPEKEIKKKGNLDEPKSSSHDKRGKRPLTGGEETKPEKKGNLRDWS